MALNALQRFDHEDELMTLVGRCIAQHHPLSERLAKVTLSHAAALSDVRLVALTERLATWLAATDDAQQHVALSAPDSKVDAAVLLTGGPAITRKGGD